MPTFLKPSRKLGEEFLVRKIYVSPVSIDIPACEFKRKKTYNNSYNRKLYLKKIKNNFLITKNIFYNCFILS